VEVNVVSGSRAGEKPRLDNGSVALATARHTRRISVADAEKSRAVGKTPRRRLAVRRWSDRPDLSRIDRLGVML
jgi:hypothetical protein